jgi:hypothetical protein
MAQHRGPCRIQDGPSISSLTVLQVPGCREKYPCAQVLRANDQLLREKKAGNAFQGYEEGELLFRPTYKFDGQSQRYDSSSKVSRHRIVKSFGASFRIDIIASYSVVLLGPSAFYHSMLHLSQDKKACQR